MGSATVPLELATSFSRHSPPRSKRMVSPGEKTVPFTFAAACHAAPSLVPSSPSEPPGLT